MTDTGKTKSRTQPNVWLLIPAYNVEPYISKLLEQAVLYIPARMIVVIDDGSHDRTAEIAESKGVNLLSHSYNRGKGAALQTGFDYLLEQDAEWVITIDGDLQHDPSMLPDFIKQAEQGDYDIVIGTRRRDMGGMPWDRRFSNWGTSLLLSIITGQKIRDSQSGYRLIRCSLLKGLKFDCTGYDFETEFLLKLSRAGARIGIVNIPTLYKGAPSSINSFIDTLKFFRVIIRFFFYRK